MNDAFIFFLSLELDVWFAAIVFVACLLYLGPARPILLIMLARMKLFFAYVKASVVELTKKEEDPVDEDGSPYRGE